MSRRAGMGIAGTVFSFEGSHCSPSQTVWLGKKLMGDFYCLRVHLSSGKRGREKALLSTSGRGQLWETPVALGKHSVPLGSWVVSREWHLCLNKQRSKK